MTSIAVCDGYRLALPAQGTTEPCPEKAVWRISHRSKKIDDDRYQLHACAEHLNKVIPKGRREILEVKWIGEFSGTDH